MGSRVFNSEALQIGRRIADTTSYLTETGAALAASPAQPELRDALAHDIAALRIYVTGLKDMPALETALDRIEQALSTGSTLATTATNTRISEELVKTAIDRFAADMARLAAIRAERDGLSKQLDAVRTALLRKSLRDEASHNMTVMTAPRALTTTQGIDRLQRTVLAGLMAFILASLFFVYLDGIRRRSA
jgi:hypothetical protein